MGITLLPAIQAGAGTALENVGKQLVGLTNTSTGVVSTPQGNPVPAGTTPATSFSAAPPTGNAAQAHNTYAIPVWVWVVVGVSVLAIGVVILRKTGGGK